MRVLMMLAGLFGAICQVHAANAFLRFPDIHETQVLFSAGGDLWLSDLAGAQPRQLTQSPGLEYFGKFSPDGRWVAYTQELGGEAQVFVVLASGGEARQLTYYPAGSGDNRVVDWTPDGQHVVVASLRFSPWAFAGVTQFVKIPLVGGPPEPMPLFEGNTLSYAGDGQSIAFTREALDGNNAWKRYHGGQAQDIWSYHFKDDRLQRLTDWRGADQHPMWYRDELYFISDRTGTLNLYRMSPEGGGVTALTEYRDLDVKYPGYGPGGIVFERGGEIYHFSNSQQRIKPLAISLNLDPKIQEKDVAENIEALAVSATQNASIVTARGELFLQQSGWAAPRNISQTPEIRERDAAISADGKRLAFIADDSGQDELYVATLDGKQRRALTRDSRYSWRQPSWSPDGRWIAVYDLNLELAVVSVANGERRTVARSRQGFLSEYSWSPDSRWLAYVRGERAKYKQIHLWDSTTGQSQALTDSRYNDTEVAFDPAGQFLAFISERDFNPLEVRTRLEWNMYTGDADRVFLALTGRDTPSPLGRSSSAAAATFAMDSDGMAQRLVALPIRRGTLSDLHVTPERIFYRRTTELSEIVSPQLWQGPQTALCSFSLQTQKEDCMADQGIVLASAGNRAAWINDGALSWSSSESTKTDLQLMLQIDPRAEWRQMFREAWRWQWNNHHFRDEKGLLTAFKQPIDWQGLLKRYLPLVERATDRHDMNYLFDEIAGELEIGHLGARGGDFGESAGSASDTGVLGADLKADTQGFYRLENILAGENWAERTRSPLTEAGVKARVGDYVLAINGQPLRTPEDPYRLLRGTLGKTVTLQLAENPTAPTWEISIVPISGQNENWLRYMAWVRTNEQRVAEATGGKVGYLHLADCGTDGLWSFARDWYRQSEKAGVIIDERANTGGLMAPVFLERIRRVAIGKNLGRSNDDNHAYPLSGFSGKTVMLADKYAGSDGDNLPYFYRKYGLGPVIGTRTWGGVIGGDALTLVDGGAVATANQAVADLNGNPELENVGVQPDIEVDLAPHEAARGKDAQLEKAIETILKLTQN